MSYTLPISIPQKVETAINHFHAIEGVSFFGILSIINSEKSPYQDTLDAAKVILDFFNEFNEKSDDEMFLHCWLGNYKVVY